MHASPTASAAARRDVVRVARHTPITKHTSATRSATPARARATSAICCVTSPSVSGTALTSKSGVPVGRIAQHVGSRCAVTRRKEFEFLETGAIGDRLRERRHEPVGRRRRIELHGDDRAVVATALRELEREVEGRGDDRHAVVDLVDRRAEVAGPRERAVAAKHDDAAVVETAGNLSDVARTRGCGRATRRARRWRVARRFASRRRGAGEARPDPAPTRRRAMHPSRA